jgi:hypothetical protein
MIPITFKDKEVELCLNTTLLDGLDLTISDNFSPDKTYVLTEKEVIKLREYLAAWLEEKWLNDATEKTK